jgi:membrane protein implicated in regulation of membrane protease activity
MDWIRDHASETWLIAAVVLGVLELLSTDLILLMLAGGALVGMVVALTGGPFVLQMLLALLVAVSLLALVRPGIVKRLHAGPDLKIGPEALIGKRGLVLEAVENAVPGRVKIGGEVWSAKPYDEDDRLEEGDSVDIVAIRGGIALVVRAQNPVPE